MNNNWKTTTVGFLTGAVLLANSLVIPLLSGDWMSIDWTGTATGLGAMGLGWFAGDKGGNQKEPTDESESEEESDRAYEEWKNS